MPEQLSHELALRFATKCYSHLEIAHFKDNFKILADHQEDVEYWKEETLCRFLALPDSVKAGSILYAMTTYLGAFPFPSLAPCIVTREAMLKVVTLLTGRYKKVLRRGDSDKNKLLFRSLAVFDRRISTSLSPTAESKMHHLIQEQQGDSGESDVSKMDLQTAATGFSIDQPLNDDEDEDDDDLALAALDALDAIEVFKEDHKKDRKIHHAHIPVYNFERMVMLLLLFAPLTPQDNVAQICRVDDKMLPLLEASAKAIISAFEPEKEAISYSTFIETMTSLTPNLFRPLSPLFEHFLFSKQLDLNKHKELDSAPIEEQTRRSPIYDMEKQQPPVLNEVLLAQLSASIEIAPVTSSSSSSFFHCGARFDQLYSTATDGTSLSSFSRQVLSWTSPSMLVMKGVNPDSGETHIMGAFLPELWKEGTGINPDVDPTHARAVMFQLLPKHAIFRANPYNKTTPISHFSSKTGISLGCVVPPASRINASSQVPVLGPVGLLIDGDISSATFQHDGDAGTGAFLTDPLLEECQRKKTGAQPKRLTLDIDTLEVWGISFPEAGGEDEITKQKKRLAWEEAEAERRKGVNFGGDKDGARHLLEMAGIIGDSAGNRSGGSAA